MFLYRSIKILITKLIKRLSWQFSDISNNGFRLFYQLLKDSFFCPFPQPLETESLVLIKKSKEMWTFSAMKKKVAEV